MWPRNCLAPPGGGTVHNSRRHHLRARSGNGALVLPGRVMGALPKFLLLSLHFVPRMGLIFKPLPGRHGCFLRNLTLPMYYCLSLVCFISCYPICDSEPTKNSFQLRCPPPCNIILEKSHFALLRKHLACLIVPSTRKEMLPRREMTI